MIDVPVVTPGVPATHRTDLLFLIGLMTAAVIRGGLFFVSFAALSPGVGWPLAGIADPGIAALLLGAGVYGATGQRPARYAYLMGVVFVVDNLAYAVGIALTYRGEDAPVGYPITLISLQIPLVVIAAMLVRRAHGAGR